MSPYHSNLPNVPDDWGMYYRNCGTCGDRYHASEGGCSCLQDLNPCACDDAKWVVDRGVGDDSPLADLATCESCGTGPWKETKVVSTVHVARKDHGERIKAGDRYKRVVHMGYHPNGPRSMWTSKLPAPLPLPPVPTSRVKALQQEAAQAGDHEMVATCTRAMLGAQSAMSVVRDAIDAAAAMDTPTPTPTEDTP